MTISQKVIKKLFSLSAGRCNHCGRELLEEDVQIGEMAHVIAKSANGPRAINTQTNDNSYENIILLCSIHHKIVDEKPEDYPIRRLNKMKEDHESWVASQLNKSAEYNADLEALQILSSFMPLLRLRSMAMDLPHKVSIDFDIIDIFDNFLKDRPTSYPFWDQTLTSYWQSLINSMENVNAWVEGNVLSGKLITHGQILTSIVNEGMSDLGTNNYVSSDNNNLVLNSRELGSSDYALVENNVHIAAQSFLYSHTNFIQYVRNNYRELGW